LTVVELARIRVFIIFLRLRQPPRPTLFPYTTLFRSDGEHSTQSGTSFCEASQRPAASASAIPSADSGRSMSAWSGSDGSAWAWRSRISSRMASGSQGRGRKGLPLQPAEQRLPVGLVFPDLRRMVVEQALAQPAQQH